MVVWKMKLSGPVSVVVLGSVVLIAAAVLLDGPLRRSLVAEQSSKVPVRALLEQSKSFPVWKGARKTSGPVMADKELLTSVTYRFHADGEARGVVGAYASHALSQG